MSTIHNRDGYDLKFKPIINSYNNIFWRLGQLKPITYWKKQSIIVCGQLITIY